MGTPLPATSDKDDAPGNKEASAKAHVIQRIETQYVGYETLWGHPISINMVGQLKSPQLQRRLFEATLLVSGYLEVTSFSQFYSP